MKITLFGASGATGKDVLREARALGWKVVAVEPSWDGRSDDEYVERREADVLKDDLVPCIEGSDAVISALGVPLSPEVALDPPPLYSEGAIRITNAMRKTGVRRLVAISASFVETLDRGPVWFRAAAGTALHKVFAQMAEMERILRATSDIDWTAVRPGWLMDGDPTYDYEVTEDVIPEDLIRTRHADLAHFMVTCVKDESWIRQTPAIAREEADEASSPVEVLKEAVA